MANPEVERVVDDLIQQGRVTTDMRNEYINLIERGLGDHLLRGADYTNKTKELAEQRRRDEQWLIQERQKIQAESDRLRQWESSARTELEKSTHVMNQLPELTAKVAAYEQRLRDYQIFDDNIVPPIKPSPDPNINKQFQPALETKPMPKPLTVDDANQFGNNLLALVRKVNKIQNEHQRLFGEPLDDDLIEHFTQTGQDPEEYWKVKHNIPGKQAEIQAKKFEAERAKIREEERAKIMAEITTDPGRVVGMPGLVSKGGLSPHLEQYTHSRALAHSQNHANEQKVDFIPPEQKSMITSGLERVSAAAEMYSKHFDLGGNPVSDEGKRLVQKYKD
jgi:hypothetical protein